VPDSATFIPSGAPTVAQPEIPSTAMHMLDAAQKQRSCRLVLALMMLPPR
jgi:hypothetical protein